MFATLLGWLTSGPLDRMFRTIDNAIDNQTQRDALKADVTKAYLAAQTTVLMGRGWWFPLFFLIPAGIWFSAVCLYSILFCHSCVLPQTWTIAALPSPLNQWMSAIVASLFIGKAGEQIIARLK